MSATAVVSTAISQAPTAMSVPDVRPGSRHRSVVTRMFVAAALVLVAVELVLDRDAFGAAVTAVAQASWLPIGLAVAASIASMWCFGAVRQVTMRAAGVDARVGETVAMSYAAGALHTTLPGGSVFATAYAFRRLRGWGASTTVATWCL